MKKNILGPTITRQEAPPSDLKMLFAAGMETVDADETQSSPEVADEANAFPPPIIEVSDEQMDKFKLWLDEQLHNLKAAHQPKQDEFARYEEAYRARPQQGRFQMPFAGACDDNIPVVAMAVDPVQALLDVEIMGQKPVFTVEPLRKSMADYKDCLEDWIQFNQLHRWKLRKLASASFFELAKLGTCIFKTLYDREEAKFRTYTRTDKGYEVVDKTEVRFAGATVVRVPRDNFYFPPGYSDVQKCPILFERFNSTLSQLRIAESSGKIKNVDKIVDFKRSNLSDMEDTRQNMDNIQMPAMQMDDYELWEFNADYDIDGEDGIPERLIGIYHAGKREFLQLRYNHYFNQKKQYIVIPYIFVDGTLDGMGLCEMSLPFQVAITRWHRMASDNAYLANTRLYVAKKNSGIEETPRIYAGRTFFVDDPSKDFRPFQAGDIYPSTMVERQNLFGMVEKRTGVSDYLTGRESPILGDRATATSTTLLLNQGMKRIKETIENIRSGLAEVIENCFFIWAQYGTEELEDIVFGQEDTAQKIKQFFLTYSDINLTGAFAVSLRATDAGENQVAQAQIQLQLIQIMMGYFEKLLAAGEAALVARAQGMEQYTLMVNDTMTAARKMFVDLLHDYNVPSPEAYVPDLAKYLAPPQAPGLGGQQAGPGGGVPGAGGPAGVEALLAQITGAGGPGGPNPANGNGSPFAAPLTGSV